MSDRDDGLIQVERLTGEIDISNVGDLGDRLLALPNTLYGLIVDLSEVTYFDSSGIRLLHELHDRLRVRSQRLVVVSPPGTPPRHVLDITAFGERVALEDSLDAARAVAQTPA
jgi:anti-anti-sigma factor